MMKHVDHLFAVFCAAVGVICLATGALGALGVVDISVKRAQPAPVECKATPSTWVKV